MSTLIQTLARQLMIVGGTYLATKGVIEQGQIEALAGIGISVVAFGWRYVELWIASKKS